METKSKYRLLGVLIVTGLVVISLPLLQGEKNNHTEVTVIKAPPFPEASTQVAEHDINDATDDQFSMADQRPLQNNSESTTIAKAPLPTETPASITEKSDDIINPVSSVNNNSPEKTNVVSADEEDFAPVNKSPTISTTPSNTKKKSLSMVSIPSKKPIIAKKAILNTKPFVVENNGLAQIKSAVWVIQLGNFKDKTAALRLTNRLRSNGYHAFIQQVSTSLGNSTRVFVGPELQQHSAFELADRLATDLHIRGVVVSYKPLNL